MCLLQTTLFFLSCVGSGLLAGGLRLSGGLLGLANDVDFFVNDFGGMLHSLGLQEGFNRGLRLMHMATELGADAPSKLPHPDTLKTSNAPTSEQAPKRPVRAPVEITFRSIVEEYVSSHNLFFVPTKKAHEKSRMPLFKVSPNVDGKGGRLRRGDCHRGRLVPGVRCGDRKDGEGDDGEGGREADEHFAAARVVRLEGEVGEVSAQTTRGVHCLSSENFGQRGLIRSAIAQPDIP